MEADAATVPVVEVVVRPALGPVAPVAPVAGEAAERGTVPA
jgi:hypothetical protein